MSAQGGWGGVVVALLLAVSGLGVARTQPRLARIAHEVKEREDVYVLPPPSHLKWMTFGYEAATVDLLWDDLLIAYGSHIGERREFHPDPYIDALIYLEPKYKAVYQLADTLLCFRPIRGTEKDARHAREILERGTRERPGDPDIWLEYGQFVAFLGPSFLTSASAEEKEQWRHDGAVALMKAVELGAEADRAVSAATILARGGERDAVIKSLQRQYVMTRDQPETQHEIGLKLEQLQASAVRDAVQRRDEAFMSRWRESYPFLTANQFLLVGPAIPRARCVGPDSAREPACARDWSGVLPSVSQATETP